MSGPIGFVLPEGIFVRIEAFDESMVLPMVEEKGDDHGENSFWQNESYWARHALISKKVWPTIEGHPFTSASDVNIIENPTPEKMVPAFLQSGSSGIRRSYQAADAASSLSSRTFGFGTMDPHEVSHKDKGLNCTPQIYAARSFWNPAQRDSFSAFLARPVT